MAGNTDPNTFTLAPHHTRVEKPWGYEIIWTPKDAPAVGKFLFVESGKRLSLQWHDQKTETLCLLEGKATMVLEDSDNQLKHIDMRPRHGYFVHVGQTHRIIAVEDSLLVESSTPESGNTVRVEDDYQRDTETEQMRAQKNRGWNG